MITAPSSIQASTRRPVPLRRRNDLIVEQIEYQRGNYYVVKDPVSLKYYRFDPEHFRVLELLDGTKSLEEVRTQLLLDFPYVRATLADLQGVVVDLHVKGLVYSDRPGQGWVLLERRRETRRKRWASVAQNILSLRLPGWDPEWTLSRLYPLVRWAYRPWALVLQVALAAAAYLLLAMQFDTFRQNLPEFRQFFGWPNLAFMYLTLAGTKVLHELGHGLTCRHFGGECHEIGVIFLVFSPTMYCDVSDSWMLKSKWKRIAIGAAGMWVESVISSVALFVWWFTRAGLLHHLCLNVFFISTISTVVFNLNPLMRYDGYYMLSDLLEIPNLSEKARTLLRNAFARTCLGIETREDAFMPQRGREWLIAYAVASTTYRWMILFGITLFLYTVLKPYELQSIGVTLAWVSLAGIVISLVVDVTRIITAPRSKPLSRTRIAVTLLATAAVVLAALTIPLPLHFEAPFLIEPHDVAHVYNAVPGTIVDVRVRPGDRVSRGDLLIRLADPDKERQYRELKAQWQVATIEVDKCRELHDSGKLAVAREQVQSLAAQVADYERQLKELTILAPSDGTVVTVPRVVEPKTVSSGFDLHAWHGTPLDEENLGCLLEARTQVLSIAPDNRFQAILLVDQSDRADVVSGERVQIKFDHLPTEVYEGVIGEISEHYAAYAPGSLSNKSGGELSTVTDPQGRERLTSIAYEATVLLDEESALLRAGMRGRSRFAVGHRSAWQWAWRWLRLTFHFRL
jgi:putative peptide zinc metalloprotease protein